MSLLFPSWEKTSVVGFLQAQVHDPLAHWGRQTQVPCPCLGKLSAQFAKTLYR